MEKKNSLENHVSQMEILEPQKADRSRDAVRENWSTRLDYILSMVGYCVGFGNLWRFPYVCNRNGGGAFLFPFVIFLVITGFPMFFLESSISQFSGKGNIQVWDFCPIFKGIGVGTTLACCLFMIFYNIYLAWPIYYMVKSCSSVLPWTTCNNSWNTEFCVTDVIHSNASSGTLYNITNIGIGNVYNANTSLEIQYNSTSLGSLYNTTSKSTLQDNTNQTSLWKKTTLAHTSTEEFWQYNVLNISEGIDHVGAVQWHIVLCLLASYIIIYLSVVKGVRSSGKVVYVTALLPYVLLVAIFIRTVMQEGAVDGILHYVKPDFNKLLHAQVWLEACLQVFYSLGPGWGVLTTAASYNKFHEPCLRHAILLSVISEGTSILSGLVTFTVLGVMSHRVGVPISKVVSSGPGLGFVTYPEALSQLPLPQLWSFIFFLMLLTVGLDSQFLNVEVLSTVIVDQFPHLLRQRRYLVTGVICIISFLLGIVFCTQGGQYIFQLLDWYIGAIATLLFCTMECLAAVWIYGLQQLSKDAEMMFGKSLPCLIKLLLAILTPVTLLIAFVLTLFRYEPPSYGNYVYPDYVPIIGWIIAFVPITPLLIFAILAVRRFRSKPLVQSIKLAMLPNDDWQPSVKEYREEYELQRSIADRSLKSTLTHIFK